MLVCCLCLLVLGIGVAGCRCSPRGTDEERLKKKIDKLRVHVYVGAKDAVARAENSGTSQALVDLVKKVTALGKGGEAGEERKDTAEAEEKEEKKGEEKEDKKEQAEKKEAEEKKEQEGGGGLSALRSTLAAGKTLLGLRKTGKRMVQAGSEAGRPVFFPWWFSEDSDEKTRLAAEHAIMLTTLFAFKAHPEVPVPVPTALVLYEAARTDPAAIADADYRPPLHLIRSFVMGTNGLCDLAQKEADKATAQQWKPEKLNALLKLIPKKEGKPLSLDKKTMGRVGVALEAGAHGSIAICYMDRKQQHKAMAALEKLVDLLEKAGVKSSRFDLVRAFSRCAAGDKAEGKKILAAIKGPEAKKLAKQIERIKQQCESAGDPGSTWQKLNLNVVLIKLVIIELRDTRILEQFDETELFKYGHGVLAAFGKLYEKVKGLGKGDAEESSTSGGGGLDWTDLL